MSPTYKLRLLVLITMQAEAQPVIDWLGLQKKPSIDQFPYGRYEGTTAQGHDVVLLTSGQDSDQHVDNVATQHAAAMTALGIHVYAPDVVINSGTAGGFLVSGSNIGDVYLVDEFIYHDRRVPLPGFNRYGIGGYQADFSSVKIPFFLATATTGNSLDVTDSELETMKILALFGPLVKDMESTAIAEICYNANLPLFVLKSVTDLVDGGSVTGEEFVCNLRLASQSLQQAFLRLLELMSGEDFLRIRLKRDHDLIDKVLELVSNRQSG